MKKVLLRVLILLVVLGAGWGVYALIGLTLIFMIFRIFLSIYGGGGVYDRLMQ